MAANPSTPELIVRLAREAQLQQLSALDSLDTKAGTLIGFAGVVLGLLFTAPAATNGWNAAITFGSSLIVLGVVPLAIALIPRKYAYNPDIAGLQAAWGAAPLRDASEAVIDAVVLALDANDQSLRFKSLYVRAGVVLIGLGLLAATGGVLYAVNG